MCVTFYLVSNIIISHHVACITVQMYMFGFSLGFARSLDDLFVEIFMSSIVRLEYLPADSLNSIVQLRAVPLAQPAHDPAPETCNWLNAILQRVYLELHHNGLKQYVLQLVVDAFNSGKFPGFVVR